MKKIFPIRLLPLVTLTLMVLLGVKIGDIWHGAGSLLQGGAGPAFASVGGEDEKAPASETGTKKAASPEGETAKPGAPDAHSGPRAAFLSKGEIEVLQDLATRRRELDARESKLSMREGVLQATERRIDGKIKDLKKIQSSIAALLKQYGKEKEAQMQSLVKIYESMKPKDAARIFEQLGMDIQLAVASRMKEKKMAALLAQMQASSAKTLTVKLATRKQLPSFK
jgi:flagellar motility protein MotE (MotC chaperone)